MRINPSIKPGFALLVLASAFSQTQNSQLAPAQESADQPLIRVTVNLVQVDAVVTDSKGNQVTNLTADDFLLLQDGKPQKITHFSYISTAAATPTVSKAMARWCGKPPRKMTLPTPSRTIRRSRSQRRAARCAAVRVSFNGGRWTSARSRSGVTCWCTRQRRYNASWK